MTALNREQEYHLNCDACGKSYWSKEAFPKPQICSECLMIHTIYINIKRRVADAKAGRVRSWSDVKKELGI